MQRVTFLYDPSCPWCWRATRWLRALAPAEGLKLEWRLLSLGYINRHEGARLSPMQPVRRLLMLVEEGGDAGLTAQVYQTLAEARFEAQKRLNQRQVVRETLAQAGLPAELVEEAWDNGALDKRIDRQAMGFELQGAIGVPSLILEGGDPFYGPIIDRVPQGEPALRLWMHVRALMGMDFFYELKRPR